MKKIFIAIVTIVSLPMSAQTTPLSLRGGDGGEAVGSYTLEQILDSARQNNIAIRSAQHNIEAAQQQRKEAFTKYFPNVSAAGVWFTASKDMAKMTVNPSEMLSPQMINDLAQTLPASVLAGLANPMSFSMLKNGIIGTISAVQPVFAGGQIINSNRLAKVGEDVSKLQLELSENEVEKTAEQYFWQLASVQEKLKTIQASEQLLGDIHKDVDVAVRAGVAMPNDLLQVQLRENEVASQKLKVENAISLVRMLLSQYCGLRDTSFVIDYSAMLPEADNSQLPILNSQFSILNSQFSTSTVQSLPEYQLLGKQVEAAKLQRKLTVGQNLPTVGVGVGYNYHNLLENDRSFGMVFATVNVPISDWWGGSHAIKRKKIEQQKAIEQLEDNTQLLQIRMQNAWNNVQEAAEQLSIAQRSIEQAKENLRLNRNYYQAGTSKMSDLLQAQLLYQQAQDRRTDAFSDYQNKLLEYKHATGQ
jgi:outer membrane protein TolC